MRPEVVQTGTRWSLRDGCIADGKVRWVLDTGFREWGTLTVEGVEYANLQKYSEQSWFFYVQAQS